MQRELIFSILGLIGGIICCVGDMLLDLKGRDNRKLGKYEIIDSKWNSMSEWRFKLSIIFAMIAVPLYSLGMYSLSIQISGTMGEWLKFITLVGSMGGFFIHAFICLLPIVYKTISDEDLSDKVISKMYDAVKIPFYLLYLILILASTVLVIIAIVNGRLNVPMYCVLLNPTVFFIIGVTLRKIKYDWFYDLPGIIMPSLGLGMFGLIGIINLI